MEVTRLAVPEVAFPYLQAQRGALDDMAGDYGRWLSHYQRMLAEEFEVMLPWLPRECESILDVGGGMSGISVLLNNHFGGNCQVTILDGVQDPPFVTSHAATFSHFSTAEKFLNCNGVGRVSGIEAREAPHIAPRFWDLVLSQKSWCFHYPPTRYMDLVRSGCRSGETRLVVDVRVDKPDWSDMLGKVFLLRAEPFVGRKHLTQVYEAR